MSVHLLANLEFIQQHFRDSRTPYLMILAKEIQQLEIAGDRVIIEPRKWGDTRLFNGREVNRFDLFVLILYQGQFSMAKEMLDNINMPWLMQRYNLIRKTFDYEGLKDTIMYNIHSIFELFCLIIVENFITKKSMSYEALSQELRMRLQRRLKI